MNVINNNSTYTLLYEEMNVEYQNRGESERYNAMKNYLNRLIALDMQLTITQENLKFWEQEAVTYIKNGSENLKN